jgi:hypothetical protein
LVSANGPSVIAPYRRRRAHRRQLGPAAQDAGLGQVIGVFAEGSHHRAHLLRAERFIRLFFAVDQKHVLHVDSPQDWPAPLQAYRTTNGQVENRQKKSPLLGGLESNSF